MLTTEETARQLGVKPATIYAYVSRGLLTSERNADGKGSLFAESEVEAFAAGRRRSVAPGESPPIHTGITLIRDGALYYRGHDATVLARTTAYEAVAALLWGDTTAADPGPGPWFRSSPVLLELAEAVTAPLPRSARLTDRLRVVVAAAAAADPLRFDTAPAAVLATGRTMLATMVAALPLRQPAEQPFDDRFPVAGMLWPRLTAADRTPEGVAALNAALVLLADHDIAASTLAARVAASTRAHPYAVVGAGLAALDGPLHGAAGGLAYALLQEAVRTDPLTAISASLRIGGPAPGFGHRLYPAGDPRARALLTRLDDQPTDRGLRATIDAVAAAVTQRSGVEPNIDFAVAAFALLNGMPADAGEAIFAIARTAGWIAHALEEYGDRPSRFRPIGQYAGRPPTG
jgi:citrate synthase